MGEKIRRADIDPDRHAIAKQIEAAKERPPASEIVPGAEAASETLSTRSEMIGDVSPERAFARKLIIAKELFSSEVGRAKAERQESLSSPQQARARALEGIARLLLALEVQVARIIRILSMRTVRRLLRKASVFSSLSKTKKK